MKRDLLAAYAAVIVRKPPSGSAPTLASSTVNGSTLTDVYSAAVSFGAGGNGGKSLAMSGGAATPTYTGGAGTPTITYSLSRAIAFGETGTSGYTQPGNGLEATSGGTDVAAYSGFAVTNATSGGGAPTFFDHLYPSGLTLTALSNEAITSITRPATRAAGSALGNVQWTGVYGEKCFKVTDLDTDGHVIPVTQIRHEYSRRFAMNCDSSLYIVYGQAGFWRLYHGPKSTVGTPFTPINASNTAGMLNGLAGLDVEPDWHVSDPLKLGYWGGGMIHYWKTFTNLTATTVTETNTVRVNFTGRLPASNANQVWTKSEGMSDAAQRYYGFMATRYNSSTGNNEIFHFFTWDSQTDTILGVMSSDTFGGILQFPDHCSMSASGTWFVPSWAFSPTRGTRALPRDLSSFGTMLRNDSQHSDCAFGPSGEDFLVYADYVSTSPDEGYVVMVNMATGAVTRLFGLYYTSGSTGMHISAKCFNRPGWVVVSTYGDDSNFYAQQPAVPQQPIYRKVFLCELHASPVMLNVTHTQANQNYGAYFGEHQATTDRWLSHVMWATNFNDATSTGGNPKVEDALVALHSNSVPAARTT